MFGKRAAAIFMPVLMAGPAFAGAPVPGRTDTSEKTQTLSEELSVLHAVGQAAISFSEMADQRAKSELVKNYARNVAAANAKADAKLMAIAKQQGIRIAPLDAQTEAGKSLMDRIEAERVLLSSLEGDAWDKEYMTLVTNTQQSVIHLLEGRMALAKDPTVKQFMADLKTSVQGRLKTAQDVMVKVYRDEV